MKVRTKGLRHYRREGRVGTRPGFITWLITTTPSLRTCWGCLTLRIDLQRPSPLAGRLQQQHGRPNGRMREPKEPPQQHQTPKKRKRNKKLLNEHSGRVGCCGGREKEGRVTGGDEGEMRVCAYLHVEWDVVLEGALRCWYLSIIASVRHR